MKIIRSYVLRESILPFILSLGILTCVFLLGNLIQLTNLVINKGVSITIMGRAFLLYIPMLLGYTIPIACLISTIMTFSRFSSDNEILALRACGVHLSQLLYPLFLLGLIVSLFSVILNEKIIPYAHHEQRKIFKNIGSKNPSALLEAGLFIRAFKPQVLFIHKINGNKLQNVTIYQPQKKGSTRTIIAKRGEFTPVPGEEKIKLKLMDGTFDEPNLEDKNSYSKKLNFNTYFMTLDISEKKDKLEKKPQGMTLKELKREINDFDEKAIDSSRLRTEYHRKIAWSISALCFVLLGFPIAVITNKREKSANIVLAIFCGVMYYLISLGCQALSIERIADPAFIMWVPNMIALLASIILNYKCVS